MLIPEAPRGSVDWYYRLNRLNQPLLAIESDQLFGVMQVIYPRHIISYNLQSPFTSSGQ